MKAEKEEKCKKLKRKKELKYLKRELGLQIRGGRRKNSFVNAHHRGGIMGTAKEQ